MTMEFIINNDIKQLKKMYGDGEEIKFEHYREALKKTNGGAINSTECIIFLNDIGCVSNHQLMLDGALMGNPELMKYVRSKGEDLFQVKTLMYIFGTPNNKSMEYMVTEMRLEGLLPDEQVDRLLKNNSITTVLSSKLKSVRQSNGKSYGKRNVILYGSMGLVALVIAWIFTRYLDII